MFTDLFGGAPHARVFDFLADEVERDHTITEIARGSEVARPTVYKVIEDLVEKDVVEETRTVGNSRFFQLDKENRTVRSLLHVAKPTEFADFTLTNDASGQSPQRATRGGRRQTRQG